MAGGVSRPAPASARARGRPGVSCGPARGQPCGPPGSTGLVPACRSSAEGELVGLEAGVVLVGGQAGVLPGGEPAFEVGDVLEPELLQGERRERGAACPTCSRRSRGLRVQLGLVPRAGGIGDELQQASRDLHGAWMWCSHSTGSRTSRNTTGRWRSRRRRPAASPLDLGHASATISAASPSWLLLMVSVLGPVVARAADQRWWLAGVARSRAIRAGCLRPRARRPREACSSSVAATPP